MFTRTEIKINKKKQQRLSNGSLRATYTDQSISLGNGEWKSDTPTQTFNSSQQKIHLAARINLQAPSLWQYRWLFFLRRQRIHDPLPSPS